MNPMVSFASTVCLILLVFAFNRGHSLRLTNMTAPIVADTRQKMNLYCRFDMENEELYAVKWYKGDHEFFRFRPDKGAGETITFPVPGVHLDLRGTFCDKQHCRLRLEDLTRHHTDGAYKCEVSSEAPTFRLAAETHNITVATLPEEPLRIEVSPRTYKDEELISANCTVSASDPDAIVTWYINNEQAPRKYIHESALRDHGHPTRTISLNFVPSSAREGGIRNTSLELTCEASLPGIPLAPQTATVIVTRAVPPNVSNQKLHWLNGGSWSSATNVLAHSRIVQLSVVIVVAKWIIN